MLSTHDFAHRVWVSLEDIRERLAVLENEVRHTRCHLRRLEGSLSSHIADHQSGRATAQPALPAPNDGDSSNGASITLRLNRKALGGGGLLGGGLVGLAAGAGKAFGWL